MEAWSAAEWSAVYLSEGRIYLHDELECHGWTPAAHKREDRVRTVDYAVRLLALEAAQ